MPLIPEFILLLVAAYFIGAIPIAYLTVRWRYGEDIRRFGSGQVGASNVYHSFSKPLAIAVGLFDFFKGILLVWIAQLLGLNLPMQIAVATAVIAGHNWPVFLRFNAGRGLATTIGVSLYLFPWGIIPFVFFAAFTLLLGSSPLPLLVATASLPLSSFLMQYFGHPQPLVLTIGLTLFFVLLVIRRLTAPRSAESRSINLRRLLFNRLLFDRDIRDGEAWVRRKPR